jgi:hypothetical protein
MSETVGTVRADLVADPTGFKRGVEAASADLQRIAAVGTAVGNVLAQAFIAVASKFADMARELAKGKGELWDQLSANGQRAVSVVVTAFNSLNEAGTSAAAQIIERVGPALAQMIQYIQDLNVNTGLLKAVFEGVVLAIKAVVTVAISAVAAVSDLFNSLQALGSMAAALAQTLGNVVANAFSPSKAAEAWNQGMAEIGRINEETARRNEQIWQGARDRIANIWSNSPIKADIIKPEIDGIDKYMRKLEAEALRVFEATRTPAERAQYEIDKLSQLFRNGLISAETYARGIDLIKDKYSGMRDVLKQVGTTIANSFTDAILEGKKFSDVLQSLVKDLLRIALNKVFTDILLGSNTKQGGIGGLLGGIGGLFGFAQGGSFTVGGAGGIDSQVAAFRATPGERVTVTKPGQGMGGNSNVSMHVSLAGANGDDALKRAMFTAAELGAAKAIRATNNGLAARQTQLRMLEG